ncbi:MAG TPA: hypothetical protein VMV56_04680 [Williamwhitmania sp.]|nr:hypothetical protein [Williamwhitmania sp.]
MKTKNLLFISLVAGIFSFYSCSKDSSTPQLTNEQAQAEIGNVSTSYTDETTAMDNTQGMAVYNQITMLNLPFTLPTEGDFSSANYVKSFTSRLSAVKGNNFTSMQMGFNFRRDFYLQDYVGTWEYNPQTQQFDHTPTPSNVVVIKFPYPNSSATNNAIFTISKYTIVYNMGEYSGDYQANLTLNGTEVWSVDYTAIATISSTSTNFTQNVTINFAPYVYTESVILSSSFSETSATITGNASRTLKKNTDLLLSGTYNVSMSATKTNANFNITGDLTILTIRFHFVMAYSGDGSTTPNINDLVKITVYNTSGAKVGEMKFVTNQDQELVLMFYFNDGTSVDASTLFGNVLDEWTSFFGTAGDAWNFKK